MSQSAKDLTNQDKTLQITNSGALMMTEDTELKTDVSWDRRLPTPGESKTQSASTVTSTRL